ncbi:hypothetical protein ES692_06020 [Psychroserpens burtonensis]|uniref:Uncharacterized protein n=1 Tax=Psychroserpens burtonensis TaxID=49278 RepID=A0A5C7BAC9_9FLAO|nr:hypothetical protein [Psychroserpens burtonensis]TXE18597.1 hypothetical protein ES692_06020 [Psychroserpens burtonensis]
MTDQDFCKIETAISGEEIDKVEQLTHCSFTGRELKEYIEQAFVIYGVSGSLTSKEAIDYGIYAKRKDKEENLKSWLFALFFGTGFVFGLVLLISWLGS